MADNAPSKIQYDDFIANVQPDPAKPESTIMLSGFIGHGGDGVVRVYPDPSLGTWYDVPETDVVHSMAGPDSKLGGSYVWVRSSSQIKPGSAAPAAAAAAPVAQAAPNFTIGAGCTFICAQPGAALQPPPATHCFVCPSITQQCMQPTPTADVTLATICTQHNFCVQPTPTAHVTLATICTQHCTLPQVGCPPYITQPVICGILPPSIGCTQQGCAPGAQPAAQFAAAAVHPTPTAMPTPATMCFICPPLTQDCTAATVCSQQCTMPLGGCLPPNQTVATVCTQQCTTPLGGCLPMQTAATVCTQQGCAPGAAQPFAAAAAMQPTPSAVNQCGGGMIQPTPSALNQCGVHTAATICTQPPACHPSVNVICPTPSAVHQCGTQPPACHPSVNVICPTPSAVHQCGTQ